MACRARPPDVARYPLVAWLERRTRRQVTVVAVLVALYLLFRGASSLAGVILDRWWYHSVTDAPVWSTITWAQAAPRRRRGHGHGRRSSAARSGSSRRGEAPPRRRVGGIVRRYRDRMGPAHRWLLVAVVVFLTVRIAAAANAHWQAWLLFRHGDDLGRSRPRARRRPRLLPVQPAVPHGRQHLVPPAAARHARADGRRLLVSGGHPPARPRAHVAAAGARPPRPAGGAVRRRPGARLRLRPPPGAGDDTGGLVRRAGLHRAAGRSSRRPGSLAVVAFVAGFAARRSPPAPASGGRRSSPGRRGRVLHVVLVCSRCRRSSTLSWSPRPRPTASCPTSTTTSTRPGRRSGSTTSTSRAARSPTASTDGAGPHDDALDRIPLFDTTQLPAALQVLQGTTATRITDVDLDRYEIDGELRPVMVAARSASRGDLPERAGCRPHLVYTHGDGVVAVPADQPDADGRPDVDALADDARARAHRAVLRRGPRGWYAIVGTKREEQGGERVRRRHRHRHLVAVPARRAGAGAPARSSRCSRPS